jgi:hypothetical protein
MASQLGLKATACSKATGSNIHLYICDGSIGYSLLQNPSLIFGFSPD